jgi:hypothetical protein
MVNAADHAAAIFTDRTRDPEITDNQRFGFKASKYFL